MTSLLALAVLHPAMHRDPSTLEVGPAALLSNALIGCQEVDRPPLKQPLGSRRRLPIRCSRLFTLHLLEPIYHLMLSAETSGNLPLCAPTKTGIFVFPGRMS